MTEQKAGPPDGTAEIERRKPLLQMLSRYEDDFSAVLPSHTSAAQFIGLAMAYVRNNRDLNTAAFFNPDSLIRSLREIAAWGHLPQRGIAALVPFKSKRPEDGGWSITAIEEVGGVKQRILRAGGVSAIHCDVVREQDRARFQRTSMKVPYHEYDEFASAHDRGPLRAVYAYADMIGGGTSAVVWMARDEVAKHRNLSKSGAAFWGPEWPAEGPWTPDMWKKTAIHKLKDDLPNSPEFLWQRTAAAAADGRPPADTTWVQTTEPARDVDVFDGHFTEGSDEWPDTAKPAGKSA